MKAFITGSQAYGKPTERSDVDLVVRTDRTTADALKKLLEDEDPPKSGGAGSVSLKIGKLNLLLAVTDEAYEAWATGTEALSAMKPVERPVAVNLFKRLFGAA